MTLSNQYVFLTTEVEGFRVCRDTRSAAGMTMILCEKGHIDVYMYGEMVRVAVMILSWARMRFRTSMSLCR